MIDFVNFLFSDYIIIFVILYIFAEGYILFQLFPIYFNVLVDVIKKKKSYNFKQIFFQLIGGFLVLVLIKETVNYLWGVPRPYIVFGLSYLDSIYPHDNTLISGHSATSLFLALFTFNFSKTSGYINLFLALIGSLLRALLLIHWWKDIVFGWWVGFIVFLIFWLLSQKIN